MRWSQLSLLIGIVALCWGGNASPQTLEDYCAADPGLASCDPNAPGTLEEYCQAYPDWAGCQDNAGLTTCERNPDFAGCTDEEEEPPIYITVDPDGDSEEFEPADPEEVAQDEEDNAEIDGFVEGLTDGDEDTELLDEDETPEFDADAYNELIEAVDRELEAERACANLARLTALSEQLEFEADEANERYISWNRSEIPPSEEDASTLENELASFSTEFSRVNRQIEDLEASGETVPPLLRQQRSFIGDEIIRVMDELDRQDGQSRTWRIERSLHVQRMNAIAERRVAVQRQIDEINADCP